MSSRPLPSNAPLFASSISAEGLRLITGESTLIVLALRAWSAAVGLRTKAPEEGFHSPCKCHPVDKRVLWEVPYGTADARFGCAATCSCAAAYHSLDMRRRGRPSLVQVLT